MLSSSSKSKQNFLKRLSRKKWFRIIRPILIAALVFLVIYILTVIGVFKIKSIGTTKDIEYANEVYAVFDNYIGEGYFFLNLDTLTEDIYNLSRYIKEVSAQKVFPNSIRIDIEEYIPKYYFESQNICYTMSEEGLILNEEEEYEECGKDIDIMLQSNQNIMSKDRLIFDNEVYQAVKVLEEFGWEISNISFDRTVLNISDNDKEVILEINDEYQTQLARLYIVLEKINIEGIDYRSLDLRFNRPVMQIL